MVGGAFQGPARKKDATSADAGELVMTGLNTQEMTLVALDLWTLYSL